MIDQYRCFRTAHGGWSTDFIGSVENANEDWRVVSAAGPAMPA
jgi:hypothetical protein